MLSLLRILATLLLTFWLLNPSQTASGAVLITRGDTFKELGPITQGRIPGMPANLKVGYKYSYFGIFWLDFWTWDGEYCLFENMNYQPLTQAEAAFFMGKEENELGKPFWYRFPAGLVIIGGFVVVVVPLGLIGQAQERRVRKLFEDPRYAGAIQVIRTHAEKRGEIMSRWVEESQAAQQNGEEPPPQPIFDDGPTPPGYAEALDHLLREGIEREQAEKNLQAMLKLLQEDAQKQG